MAVLGPAMPGGAAQLSLRDRNWPQTNCYVDVWMTVLRAWGLEELAGLGFTVLQDFEADQFTFFKFPLDDLRILYGLNVQELSIYDPVDQHAARQNARGALVLVEVDGYFLPDLRSTSYRLQHTKTTIAIEAIRPDERWLRYYHNNDCYTAEAEDYDGLFRTPAILPPYVEIATRRWTPLQGASLGAAAARLLRGHLRRRPESNPITRFAAALPVQMERLAGAEDFFHLYAFNTVRQLGANFELLGMFLAWLAPHCGGTLGRIACLCQDLSGSAKAVQYRLARVAARGRPDLCRDSLASMAMLYDQIMLELDARFR